MSETENTRTTNLMIKLAEVAKECAYVQKDGSNSFHKYKYASAEAVLQKVSAALTARNICRQTQAEYEVLPNGNVICSLRIFLLDGDDPKFSPICFTGLGEGSDKGDKATMKALTAAHKYAYATGLGMSWGDDPEADAETDRRAAKPAAKKQTKLDSMKGGF